MKEKISTQYLVTTALFAAMITVMTAYICHIPVGFNGGYVHFGDAFIYLCASILPTPYAMAAGAIGGGLADLLTAPMWFFPTLIIKMLIAVPFTAKKERIITARNIAAPAIAAVITVIGYYIAERALFGSWAAFWTSVSGSVVQAVGSAAIFLVFGTALDQIRFKEKASDILHVCAYH